MNIPSSVAGIIATFAMTLFIELICATIKKPFHVVSILSDMLRFGKSDMPDRKKKLIYVAALVLHYLIGVLFACGFKLCLEANVLESNWSHALIFGAAVGLIGVIGWRIFFAVHPKPPALNLFHYLTVIWLGHMIFSIVQFYIYEIGKSTPG